MSTVRFIRKLFFDFNQGKNRGGFYEVVLDDYVEPPAAGDEVMIGDSEGHMRGRIRCLIAVVEPIGDYIDLPASPADPPESTR